MPKLSLREVFSVSFQSLHIEIFLPFLIPTLFYILSTAFLFQYLGRGLVVFDVGVDALAFVYRWMVFILISILMYILLMAFSFNLSSITIRDYAISGKKNYKDSIREARSKIFNVFVVNILALVIVLTGFFFYAINPFLAIMGLFFAPFLFFISPSVSVDGLSPFKAIKNSLILTLKYTTNSFILFGFSFFVLFLLPVAISIGIFYFSPNLLEIFIIYGAPIIVMIFAAYVTVLATVSYLNYRGY